MSTQQSPTTNLYAASNQWAYRPADERYWNVVEAYEAAKDYRQAARIAKKRIGDITVRGNGELTAQVGQSNARFTHYGFSNLCNRVGVPASYLRTLPNELAAQNLNYALQKNADMSAVILAHQNAGELMLRCTTSNVYSRIWNSEILEKLCILLEKGWVTPPARPCGNGDTRVRPATAADVLRFNGKALSIKEGDAISPAGVYLSDHDLFVFMVNEQVQIDDGTGKMLSRGFFVRNSEVCDGALHLTTFLYDYVCGNHIIWNATQVNKTRVIHKGNAAEQYPKLLAKTTAKALTDSGAEQEAAIKRARNLVIADSREALVEALYSKRVMGKKDLDIAYDFALEQADLHKTNPDSVWGYVQGITAYSQTKAYGDERATIDAAATKLLSWVA